jgi:hypothetical protein
VVQKDLHQSEYAVGWLFLDLSLWNIILSVD